MTKEIYGGFNPNSASLRRSMETNINNVSRLQQQLGAGTLVPSPSFDPASAAIAAGSDERIGVLNQCNRNALQMTSTVSTVTNVLANTNSILQNMERLAIQANNSANDQTSLVMLDNQFQSLLTQVNQNANSARSGTKQLLSGVPSTVTANATTVANPTATNLAAGPANTLAGTLNTANTSGFIDGVASAATVTLVSGGVYKVSVSIGNQTFEGMTTPAAGGVLTLVSTTDSGNIISFDYAAGVGGITDAATFQTALQTSLGVNTGTKAVFTSKSTAATYAAVTINPSSSLSQGTWALTYTVAGSVGTFKITNGVISDTVTTTNANPQSGTLSFSKTGISLALTAFNGSATLAQQTFFVSGSGAVSYQAQIGLNTTDLISLSFQPATTTALNLTGLNLQNASGLGNVISSLKAAITSLNSQIAVYSSASTQIESLIDNLKVTIENEEASKASFVEPNVATMLSQIQKFDGLYNMAEAQFLKSLQKQQSISELVQRASR